MDWNKFYDDMIELSNETIKAEHWRQDVLDDYGIEQPDVVAESVKYGLPIIEYIEDGTDISNALYDFYESKGEVLETSVRDCASVDYGRGNIHGICFAHGVGYDWIDKDLLGGNGSGSRHKEFADFVRGRKQDKTQVASSPAIESANAKKRAEEINNAKGQKQNKSKGQRNR